MSSTRLSASGPRSLCRACQVRRGSGCGQVVVLRLVTGGRGQLNPVDVWHGANGGPPPAEQRRPADWTEEETGGDGQDAESVVPVGGLRRGEIVDDRGQRRGDEAFSGWAGRSCPAS